MCVEGISEESIKQQENPISREDYRQLIGFWKDKVKDPIIWEQYVQRMSKRVKDEEETS